MTEKPIIALDFSTYEEAKTFLTGFDEKLYVKIGMELYMQSGPAIIDVIKAYGHDVFLDLKLHDIPTTVERTMSVLGKLNVDMVNVHASGGYEMMKRAASAFRKENADGKIIAVTQLTSMDEHTMQREQQTPLSLTDSVLHYAKLAYKAGLDGVVSSPLESRMIHNEISEHFLTVTPGIRLSENNNDDQVRVVTPNKAKQLGSDYIVVGRPITQSDNPAKAYKEIKQLWEGK